VFQYIAALARGQRLAADPAIQHSVGHAWFGPHADDLIARMTMRAGKVLLTVFGHHSTAPPRPPIPPYSKEATTGLSMSNNAARHSRARCTRLRTVPPGQPQA